MSRSKLIVSGLEDALLAHADYPGAATWRIAPLTSMSGARSWQVPSSDGKRWVRVDDVGAVNPGIDDDPDDLPELPACRQGLWAFIFADSKGKVIKPEIIVGNPESQEQEPAKIIKANAKAETIGVFNVSLAQANADARAAQKVANESVSAVVGHFKDLLSIRKEEFDRLKAEHETLKAQHDKLREENTACLVAMAELCNRSDFAETIRHLFGDRPELLVGALKDLAGGVMRAIGSSEPKPKIGGKAKAEPSPQVADDKDESQS